MNSRIALPCVVVALALTTAACSGSGDATSTTSTTSTVASSTPSQGGGLAVKDPWVKAVKGGMTGVFATLDNPTDKPIHVVKAETPLATMAQLHVTTKDASGAMVMRESKDGFTVPAKGSFELRPGGNHIMLMGLKGPVLSGTTATVTLVAEDGTRTEITAPAREFNGAKETYGGMSMTPNQTASGSGATPSTTHS